MQKIFNNLKDVIQEDEKFSIRNRFINYGYNKNIIFAKNKNYQDGDDGNKNKIFNINNNGLNPRLNYRYFKNQ